MALIGDYIHYYWSNYQTYGTNKGRDENSNFSEVTKVFNDYKDNIKRKVQGLYKNQANIKSGKELEDVLNAILYLQENDNLDKAKIEQLRNRFQMGAKQSLEHYLTDFAIDWSRGGDVYSKGTSQMGGKKLSSIKLSTVKNIAKKVNSYIQLLSQGDLTDKEVQKSIKGLEAAVQKLEELENDLNQALQERNSDVNKSINLRATVDDSNWTIKNKTLIEKIKNINAIINNIALKGRSNAIGETFEAGIAALDKSFDSHTNKHINYYTQALLKTLTGTKQVKVSNLNTERFSRGVNQQLNTNKNFTIKANNQTMKIKNDFNDSTISKMDVNLEFDDYDDYRITAKNYKLQDKKTITLLSKVSPLLNQLMRTTDDNDTINHYINIVSTRDKSGRGAPENLLQQAHETIQYGIMLEALSGFSQPEGYSNYLVVNNRTARKVKVIAINSLLDDIQDYCLVNGYPKDKIGFYRGNIWAGGIAAGPSYGLANKRIARLITYLRSIKIGVTMNVDKLFK